MKKWISLIFGITGLLIAAAIATGIDVVDTGEDMMDRFFVVSIWLAVSFSTLLDGVNRFKGNK